MAGEVSVLALLDLMGTGMIRAFLGIRLHKTHTGLLQQAWCTMPLIIGKILLLLVVPRKVPLKTLLKLRARDLRSAMVYLLRAAYRGMMF